MSDESAIIDIDVVIVGAGLSGIGAAVRLQTECPRTSFVILEARAAIGGTWDLFRYPGVRSDSDMFTLGYAFNPWTGAKTMADGTAIRNYIEDTARKFHVDETIRLQHRIVRADWSSEEQRWTLQVLVGEGREPRTYRCRFLYLCSGYYSYERAHVPELAGRDAFRGRIVHPQWWPHDLDYTNKRVVVIGSGATAVTLVPAMANDAAHVTMLQRSPTYVMSLPGEDRLSQALRRVLPESATHRIVRGKNVVLGAAFYQFCRRAPSLAKRVLRRGARSNLPSGYPVDEHFRPRYNPWDERLCVVPDGDLFTTLSSGKASIVTDTIETLTESGIRLSSGRELPADIIVTATGLELSFGGDISLHVDGRRVEPKESIVYKGVLLSGVPNLGCAIGYVNASWTLRADLCSRYVCRLLTFMDRHGYGVATAKTHANAAEARPVLDLASGYVRRAVAHLPKQGSEAPWLVRQNYILDLADTMLGRVDDEPMSFQKKIA